MAACPAAAQSACKWFSELDEKSTFATAAGDATETGTLLSATGQSVVEYPGPPNKASQLNFAVSNLSSDWVSIYDVDSRPTGTDLQYFADRNGNPFAIVRPPHYYSTTGTVLTRLTAAGQNVWTLLYEVTKWHRGTTYYFVGHGISLQRASLCNDPISTIAVAEDLEYGYRASSRHSWVALSPYVDRCTVPPTTLNLIHQAGRWLYGDFQATRSILSARARAVRRVELLLDWVVDPAISILAAFVVPMTIPFTVAEALSAAVIAKSSPWSDSDSVLLLAAGRLHRSALFALATGVELARISRQGLRRSGFDPSPH